MRNLLLVFFCFITIGLAKSQELNCTVTINSDQVASASANKSIFTTLTKSMMEFLNNRRWTEMTFASSERIECSINMVVKKVDGDMITADLQVQSRRPVFGANYKSTLFNYKDNFFSFKYKEFDQLEMNGPTSFSSNLTAVLAYYAYIIIGYDMDSFSRLGGSPYFTLAESIVNASQGTDGYNDGGWEASFKNTKNRYALINNLNDEAFKKFRNFIYEYHRLGLDEMSANAENARARISTGLPLLREANRARPSAIAITTFFDAKDDELINIYTKASTKEKADALEIFNDINPTKSSRYEQINKTQ
jgi:Domain of unknown function (DUF4835)